MGRVLTRIPSFESFDLGGLEVTDQIVTVPDNYPSKGARERGAFFFDSEGNLLALGQATREGTSLLGGPSVP